MMLQSKTLVKEEQEREEVQGNELIFVFSKQKQSPHGK